MPKTPTSAPDSSLLETPAARVDVGAPSADEIIADNISDTPDNLDAAIPPHNPDALPIVGLGGSAGAIPALREFFSLMPNDSGMAFVVVIHLSPTHESTLPQILQASTPMRVVAVTEAVKVEPNCVYVIAPNLQLAMNDGHIQAAPLENPRGRRVAVDLFFRTLADTHGTAATGVILSGADGDGAIGLRRIKERGGLTVAQEPDEAEHESMPRTAIATGMVDWVLPIDEMPSRLIDFRRNEKQLRLPPEAIAPVDENSQRQAQAAYSEREREVDETALREVLTLLRARTGRDFLHYKRATVLRRIGRRLQVNSIQDIPRYLDFLRTHPGECGALLGDLLISVTNFFRDADAFEALRMQIPNLFQDKTGTDQVRVWVAGCASGEEAYSVSMLLHEYSSHLEEPPSILVFATDISEEAIQTARDALYPETIAADVTPERLRRFFTHENHCYRARKELRESILFASHDLLKDSPFSRLDLITCRNLLIYLNRDAQRRAFETFHFALRPEGVLFLGNSESADDLAQLYAPMDKKHRIYQRLAVARAIVPPLPVPAPRAPLPLSPPEKRRVLAAPVTGVEAATETPRRAPGIPGSELHRGLLELYAPPSVLINAEYEVLHLSEHARKFLQFPSGDPSNNLLDIVHPSLRLELGTALFTALQKRQPVRVSGVPMESEDGTVTKTIDLEVRPALDDGDARGLILVVFQEVAAHASTPIPATPLEPVALRLAEEVQHLKNSLRETVEQYEDSVEELKASNEELQAMNEEARSTSEELETGKEELQSVNEELITVNGELKNNVEELARSNSDLQNLMASTDIATIFLDRDFRIRRFTPPAGEVFNVRDADMDRSLFDLTHRLEYSQLKSDIAQVLRDLKSVEREVSTHDGRWFLARILPYRAEAERIDGVVLTLIDITSRKQHEDEVKSLAQRVEQQARIFATTLTAINDFAYIFDRDGRFIYSNQPLLDLLGITLEDIIGKNFFDLKYPADLAARLQNQIQQVFDSGKIVKGETPFVSSTGEPGFYEYIFTPVVAEGGAVELVAGSTRDITTRKRAEHNAVFLAATTDALALSTTVEEMMQMVGAKIGVYLDLSACVFFEIEEAADQAIATHNWHRAGAQSLAGAYRISEFVTEDFHRASRAGETFIVRDVVADARADAQKYAAIGVGSFVSVPIIRDGEWQFLVVMFDAMARDWREDEIELMRELAARIWVGIERRRAEVAVRESEERLRLSVEAANIFTWETNLETRESEYSANVQNVIGFPLSPDANEVFALIHPDDSRDVLREVSSAMRGEKPLDVEHRIINPETGKTLWIRAQGVLVQENSLPARFIGITQNVSARKQIETALHESEERYRIFIEGIEDYAIFLTDPETIITTWNIGVERLLGYSEAEFIGQPGPIIFTPEDRAAGVPERETKKSAREGRAPDERWYIRKDGSRFFANGVMTVLRDENGEIRGYAKILRDITERKKMEDDLQFAHDAMEQRVLERTRELQIANVALLRHAEELQRTEAERQQLLQRVVSAQEEERRRISRELHDQTSQSLTALMIGLKTLLDAAGEAGTPASAASAQRLEYLHQLTDQVMKQVHRLAWDLRPAALDNLGLEAALRQYVSEWSEKNSIAADFVSWGFEAAPRLEQEIETALYRVVQEALINVQRHAEAKHASVLLERLDSAVVVIIEDDGKGFSTKQSAARKPSKIKNAESAKAESKPLRVRRNASTPALNRLGLMGMRERMELIGGSLTVESAVGKGTSVFARARISSPRRKRGSTPVEDSKLQEQTE